MKTLTKLDGGLIMVFGMCTGWRLNNTFYPKPLHRPHNLHDWITAFGVDLILMSAFAVWFWYHRDQISSKNFNVRQFLITLAAGIAIVAILYHLR